MLFSLDTLRLKLLIILSLYVKIFYMTYFLEFSYMARDSEALVPRMERINLLMDIYGELLTEKQRRFVQLHYGEDLSFGEIAVQYKVSRQAIYDAVKHALANLEQYEVVLGLLGRGWTSNGPAQSGHTEVISALETLRARVRRQNIIYNVDWIVNELTRITTILEGTGGSPAAEPEDHSEGEAL